MNNVNNRSKHNASMKSEIIFISLLILAEGCQAIIPSVTWSCPSDCLCVDTSVTCANTKGIALPLDLPINTTNLSLRGYDSTVLRILERFTRLETLTLTNCNIRELSAKYFKSVKTLKTLNLSHNELRSLSEAAILDELVNLNVSANRIESLGKLDFSGLGRLASLDLSRNAIGHIDHDAFQPLVSLEDLDLSGNRISQLEDSLLHPLTQLRTLDLSGNPFPELKFTFNPHLRSLKLQRLTNLTTVNDGAFDSLSQLTNLSLSHNPKLDFLQPGAFDALKTLKRLDLSHNNLTALHKRTLEPLSTTLDHLSLSGNPWTCDCRTSWLPDWANETKTQLTEPFCPHLPPNCSGTRILNHTSEVLTRLGATALLECRVGGNPVPSLTWILPRNHHIFHLYPATLPVRWYLPYQTEHPVTHDTKNISTSSSTFTDRIRVLKNGNLFISRVLNIDAGTYICLASNTLTNSTARITLTLNYQIMVHVKVISILVGLATSVAFLLVLLVFQLVRMAIDRWGCCCCGELVSPKAKQIRKMLETVEQYKSQQLERLRENYNMQMNRIKENCTQQMDRIRESYGTQVDRLRDIRDFGTQQLDKVRDQYYEQVKKVRDYSSSQMSKVRENYVFQRTRIRKFSAHQLIRFRENYKLQQLHLNKILETLNIESCRTGCSRSESMDFGPDPVFSIDGGVLPALPAPIFPGDVHSIEGSDNQSDYYTPIDSPSKVDKGGGDCVVQVEDFEENQIEAENVSRETEV